MPASTEPKGFKEAYKEFIAGGWQGLFFSVRFGGQITFYTPSEDSY